LSLDRYRKITQHTETTNYSIERLDHLGIVAGVIKDLRISELIDERLGTYEGETLSAGETVAGMIINGLGFSNKPMTLTRCSSF
jgi:transposase